MANAFDDMIDLIKKEGYHNHRRDVHSQTVSRGIYRDLLASCPELRDDIDSDLVRCWLNVPTPGGRKRKIDMLVGEPTPADRPDLKRIRIAMENKSVVTAHRNRDARFDDLKGVLEVVHRESPEAVLVGTVVIGVSERCLNVPDRVKLLAGTSFEAEVLPRLSTGDQRLWKDFSQAISVNRPDDAVKSILKFRQLPTRPPGLTHVVGFDHLILVPAMIDNVDPPRLARENPLGIDIDREYQQLVSDICRAYRVRWHI